MNVFADCSVVFVPMSAKVPKGTSTANLESIDTKNDGRDASVETLSWRQTKIQRNRQNFDYFFNYIQVNNSLRELRCRILKKMIQNFHEKKYSPFLFLELSGSDYSVGVHPIANERSKGTPPSQEEHFGTKNMFVRCFLHR